MHNTTTTSARKLTGGMLVAAVTSGALAMSGLGSAPTANADCASFFGFSSSPNCSSTPLSGAIAIGTNAQAHADGLFGAALATGTNSIAVTGGAFDFATAVGTNATAISAGLFSIATQLGSNGASTTNGSGLNIALNVSDGPVPLSSTAYAAGFGNVAVNLFGTGTTATLSNNVAATGTINIATNLGGSNNLVTAGQGNGILNTAFNALGSFNTVKAGQGPVAIAGSIAQTSQTVTKVGPGFNINGIAVGAAAPSTGRGAPIRSAATGPSPSKKRATPAAAAHTSTKKASSTSADAGTK